MKIMHVLNTNSYSGAENVAITIINEMKNENEIIYVSLDGPIKEYLKENNINFEPVKKMNIKEIRRIIRKFEPDIIHAHDFTTSVICAFACKNKKIVSHIHNNPLWIKGINIYSIVYLLASLKFKKILLVSNSIIREYIFKKFIVNKSEVIGNPIDIEKIVRLSNLAKDDKKYDIVFLGRFSEQKNPKKFIELISELKKSIQIKAVMIGSGLLKKQCEDLIKQYNLSDTIELKEFMKNPYGILKNSKILCMTSDWEGYGLVAIEAMALGKPVVATEVGGIPDIVVPECGITTNDMEKMKKEIKLLLEDDDYYHKKSLKAIERGKEINNIHTYIQNLEHIYRNM